MGADIDTIVIGFKVQETGEGQWSGFRKLKNGMFCFFDFKEGCIPCKHFKLSVNVAHTVEFDAEGQPIIGPCVDELSFVREKTLWIFDGMNVNFDIRGLVPIALALGICSTGAGVRHGKIEKAQKQLFVPCPTDDEMGRMYSLLTNGEARREFLRILSLTGNNARRCLNDVKSCLRGIYSSLDNMEALNMFQHKMLKVAIFAKEKHLHRVLGVVPVHCPETDGASMKFLSKTFRIRYWSDVIEDMAGETLLRLVREWYVTKKRKVSFLLKDGQ
jgi:hypothetical protein